MFVVEDLETIATMLRYDCLPPIRRSFTIPLVPPYLSSPHFARWIDPAGRQAFPGGALVTRWTPHGGLSSALLRDLLDRRLMRLSRVPVLSLYQHDLVCDPGGLCPVSPIAPGQIRRSSGLTLSAFPTPEAQAL